MIASTVRVLGIDPGSARTGYGIVETVQDELHVREYGCFETSPDDDVAERLRLLHADLAALLRSARPDAVAIEEIFFARNARSVIKVAQARGIALLAAAQAGVPVAEYTPLQVKVAVTGYGRAEKGQVERMVMLALGLQQAPQLDDVSDALAIAICHCRNLTAGALAPHVADLPAQRRARTARS